jgi:RNA polymerase sigma-70 factor (ECF subfamily)
MLTMYRGEGHAEVSRDSTPEAELSDLMQQHGESLFNFLLVQARDRELALDCLQDTFMRAFKLLQRGKPVNRQWLYKVARNRTIDEFRLQRQVHADSERLDELPGDEPSGHGRVRHVLAALTEDEREILYLFIFDRFKTAEIATMLGIGAGAARMRIFRARERFRTLYGEPQ